MSQDEIQEIHLVGRSNWLFTRSLRSGKRAAEIMSLIQSAAA